MSNKWKMDTDNITFKLIVIHKMFGWFFFIGFGILGFMFHQDVFSVIVGVVSLWSVCRKPEISWSLSKKCWIYKNRNYFKAYEKTFALLPQDEIEITYKGAGHMNMTYSFFVNFKPQVSPDGINDFIDGRCLLPIEITDSLEPLKILIYLYYSSGITLKFDLSQLYETHGDAFVNNLYRELYDENLFKNRYNYNS
ncbi:hypothetical protein [Photobacterium nomapromontoriensis]|uniref:hypothetical protein n=1 Tax=Photobacterium nomapromontoriensis TaxID=2910237 RepID=UPI003D0C39E4